MAQQDNIEIEIQVQVEKIEPLVEFLKTKGKFQAKHRQVDEYFTPTHRNFLGVRPAIEWLRLRNSDGVFWVNYKYWHTDETGRSHYADEFETKIESSEQLRKIFMALDIKPLITVDKEREIWLYKNYEVALDTIKGLGDFVEVEYKANSQNLDPQQVTAEMIKFLKDLGCGTIKRNYAGYPFILLY
ncbi:MAG: class IV adenylate cyclase, partial [Candidatus Gribaldobacteria bacterium]|nr:class IV adenylate cyclase [Candidatus Gribaldobacteria bacterium]